MGLYGKYTKAMQGIAIVRIIFGTLMIGLGIALRLLVCSWVTDASLGLWIGLWVLIGGLIGFMSTTRNVYGMIGYYMGFNSLTVMLTSSAIFLHAIAMLHFDSQLQLPPSLPNVTNSTNSTGNFSATVNLTNMSTSVPVTILKTLKPSPTVWILSTSNVTGNISVNASSTAPGNTTKPNCYTDQTWSNRENGLRGIGLGSGMIFVCVFEMIMAFLSSGLCYAAADVVPTEVIRRKVVVQGIYSDFVAARNVRPVIRTDAENNEGEEGRDPDAGTRRASLNLYEDVENLAVPGPSSAYDRSAGDIEMKPMGTFGKTAGEDTKHRSQNLYDDPWSNATEYGLKNDDHDQPQGDDTDRKKENVYDDPWSEAIKNPIYDEAQSEAIKNPIYDEAQSDVIKNPMYEETQSDVTKNPIYEETQGDVTKNPIYDEAQAEDFEMRPAETLETLADTSDNDDPCSSGYPPYPPYNPDYSIPSVPEAYGNDTLSDE